MLVRLPAASNLKRASLILGAVTVTPSMVIEASVVELGVMRIFVPDTKATFELALVVVMASLVATLKVPSTSTMPVPLVDATAEPPAVLMVLFALIKSAN